MSSQVYWRVPYRCLNRSTTPRVCDYGSEEPGQINEVRTKLSPNWDLASYPRHAPILQCKGMPDLPGERISETWAS